MSLKVDAVTVRYPGAGQDAVDRVCLDLAAGEVLALLGPSGCGKSTVLRAVAGLEPLAAGSIRWAGTDLADVPVHRRGFGLMFQDGQLFTHSTVAGNVGYGLPRGAGRRERVADLLDLVGLAGYQDRAIPTLSGGEQQRVALARALAPTPRLLLLDEPLSALDRRLREHLVNEIASILRATGTTALYVTHDHDEAFAIADRVAIMSSGTVLQAGSPEQVWAAPVDAHVAAFLGYRVVPDGVGELALSPRAIRVAERNEPVRARGAVAAVSWWRGEPVALVDTPHWGRVRALLGRRVTAGDRVGLVVDPARTVCFGHNDQLKPVARRG
ncbi:MAG: ABC transporter ATP-binding protein [Beutenbergiaceae bacterium]